MTCLQLRAKVAATPGLSTAKKIDGKWIMKRKADMITDLTALASTYWVPKKKAEMVADRTASANTSSGKATVSDRPLEDMTRFQLRADVAVTPGVSSAKKVDGKWSVSYTHLRAHET